MGLSGASAADWVTDTAPYEPFPAFQVAVPNLTIVNIGIDDWLQGNAPSAYNANMLTLINAILALNSDVLMVVPVPTASSVTPIPTQYGIIRSKSIV